MKERYAKTIFTIGHSTRAIDEFIALLKAHGVEEVADVRTIPRSRRYPHFNQDSLAASLGTAGIGYIHLEELGGLRHTRADSVNTGWRNRSFRGYADYMETPEFAEGLRKLEKTAESRPTAVMCAEAVPWRCHRSLIADALTVAGWKVLDITGQSAAKEHRLTPFLRIRGGKIHYPRTKEHEPCCR